MRMRDIALEGFAVLVAEVERAAPRGLRRQWWQGRPHGRRTGPTGV